MVKIDGVARLSSINAKVILVQTDTTVGFLSQNAIKLSEIKSRDPSKPFIKVYETFKSFKEANVRIPSSQKSRVRRSKKTTFIVKNESFRISTYKASSSLLTSSSWYNSTSANASGENFNREFCEEKADIIIEDKNCLQEGIASTLYKINEKKIKRLR